MELLFDKSEIARVIYESRIDMALEDWPHPDSEDEQVQNALRREAKLACAAASILWQEMEDAEFGYDISIFHEAEGMFGQLPPAWNPNDPELDKKFPFDRDIPDDNPMA